MLAFVHVIHTIPEFFQLIHLYHIHVQPGQICFFLNHFILYKPDFVELWLEGKTEERQGYGVRVRHHHLCFHEEILDMSEKL